MECPLYMHEIVILELFQDLVLQLSDSFNYCWFRSSCRRYERGVRQNSLDQEFLVRNLVKFHLFCHINRVFAATFSMDAWEDPLAQDSEHTVDSF